MVVAMYMTRPNADSGSALNSIVLFTYDYFFLKQFKTFDLLARYIGYGIKIMLYLIKIKTNLIQVCDKGTFLVDLFLNVSSLLS